MQVHSNQKHLCYCIIQINKDLVRMCSSAMVTTTNSTTNKTMILESLINSYLDFL